MVELVRSAIKWYRQRGGGQYEGNGLTVYDQAAEFLTQRRFFAQRVAELVGDQPDQMIVELAAGTGLVSSVLKAKLTKSKLAFFDLSLSALQELRRRLRGDADASVANFFSLPIASESVDKVVIVGGYRYVGEGNEDAFWREVGRVVKKDGSVYIAQFKPRISSMKGNDVFEVIDDPTKKDIPIKHGLYLTSLVDFESDGPWQPEQIAEMDTFDSRVTLFTKTVVTGRYELVRFIKRPDK